MQVQVVLPGVGPRGRVLNPQKKSDVLYIKKQYFSLISEIFFPFFVNNRAWGFGTLSSAQALVV